MVVIKLIVLTIFSLLCLLKVQAEERVVCNEEYEFMCPVDNKCISKSKVCNFVEDCLGGADEMHCGSCEFHLQTPEECGLILKSDKAFAWFRQEPEQEETKNPIFRDANDPLYYIQINLNATMKQYIYRHRNKFNLIYKPKIIFPHLRPTNNERCQASIEMRITDLGAQVLDSEVEDATWPKVSLLVVEPKEHVDSSSEKVNEGRENRKYTSIDLDVKKVSAAKRGYWLSYQVPLGAHRTVWTIELVIEALIKSSLVQISSIKYVDCQPIGVEEDEAIATDTPLENACDQNLFKCELSGLCIDKSLICDFGRDCGEEDNSDEEYCDDYLGRCDFEDESLCDWTLAKNASWIHVSASEEDQAFYGPSLARPKVDHTFQSSAKGGRYLLLNSTQLRMFTMYNLMGPHVSLQLGASECNFRFWVNTPEQLNNGPVTSPYMYVGRTHIPADRLFIEADGNNTWRRHEVRLLSRSNIEESNIFSLQVGFGFFGADIKSYLESGGYLAIDDFSFTPGCQLVYHGPALQEACGDEQFFCRNPTPVTGAQCIPVENYCDFKNDCGLDGSPNFWAEDEHDCPHECNFQRHERCTGLEIKDGLLRRLDGFYKVDDHVNEAFNWSLRLDETSGQLLIRTQSDRFLDRYKSELSSTSSLGRDNLNQLGRPKVTKNLRNLEVHLPTFSGSHANCTFQLTYKWANYSAGSVHSSIHLDSLEGGGRTYLLKRLIPTDLSRSTSQTIQIGIGHQQHPFKLLIDVYYADNLMGSIPYQGALSIYSYRFINCAFFSGLHEADKQVKFESIEDDTDDDNMEAMDYLDYQYASSSLNTTCTSGYFQCYKPIVCIPEDLVCDMQRDCQGGADEQGCTTGTKNKWIQYNFEETKDEQNLLPAGWFNEPNTQMLWTSVHGDAYLYRNSHLTGPLFDHTLSNSWGKYLMTSGKGTEEKRLANLYSPLIRAGPQCKRIVFYLYYWGRELNKFQVFKQYENKEILLYELDSSSNPKQPLVDQWQRVSLPLWDSLAKVQEFRLIFRGFSGDGRSDVIALDDISFGPLCNLTLVNENSTTTTASKQQQQEALISNVNENQFKDQEEVAKTEQLEESKGSEASRWVKVGVVLIGVALLVMVSVGCQAKNLLNLTQLSGLKESHEDNLTASGFMMELSLEDLSNKQPCDSPNNNNNE